MKGNNTSFIPNELASAIKGGYVTSTELIKDYMLSKSLEELNQLFNSRLLTLSNLVNISINGETFDIATHKEDIVKDNAALTTANAVAEYLQLFALETQLKDLDSKLLFLINNLPKEDLSNYVTLSLMTISIHELELQLDNYYKKIDTYSKNEIDDKLLSFLNISILITDELPQVPENNVLYLVPSLENLNIYQQWFYQNNEYILLESKTIDLTGYVTSLELPNIIQNAILGKQNILVNGENIKSVNNISLLGSGNIDTDKYHSLYTNNLIKTNISLGNIPSEYMLANLNNRSISEILDMILFKEEFPDTVLRHNIRYSNIEHIVEEGNNVILPTVTAIWNSLVTPLNLEILITLELINPSGTDVYGISQYDNSGTWTWKLYCTYPESTYTVTSNFGNTDTKTIPAVNNYLFGTEIIEVSRPVFINDEKQKLFAIQTQQVITKTLGGRPKIEVPWANSEVKIEVDLGFGYMNVNGWSRTQIQKNGKEYIKYEKDDSYSLSVPHRITIKLVKI